MAKKQGRPKSATTSVVISIRVDEGVLDEIDRLMDAGAYEAFLGTVD